MKNLKLISFLLGALPLVAFQKVDINEASREQIALLPSIGDTLAKAVVQYRIKHKRIGSSDELALIQGMTPKKLEKIMPHIIFGGKKEKAKEPSKIESVPLVKKNPTVLIPFSLLEKKAFIAMGLSDELEKDMSGRARRSAWLPRLGFVFDLDRDTAERNFRKKTDAEKRGSLDLGLGLRASFDLPELIFSKSELEVANLAQRRSEKREKLSEKLQMLYFRYARLNEDLIEPKDAALLKNTEATLRELSAALDSLSNNAFSDFQMTEIGT